MILAPIFHRETRIIYWWQASYKYILNKKPRSTGIPSRIPLYPCF